MTRFMVLSRSTVSQEKAFSPMLIMLKKQIRKTETEEKVVGTQALSLFKNPTKRLLEI